MHCTKKLQKTEKNLKKTNWDKICEFQYKVRWKYLVSFREQNVCYHHYIYDFTI